MRLVEDADPIGAPAPRPASFAQADVVELRRYTLRPATRPVLLRLFEDHLIAGQEAVGMLIGGIFEDVDQPDRFVWWRAFDDMHARRRALEAFYSGPDLERAQRHREHDDDRQ